MILLPAERRNLTHSQRRVGVLLVETGLNGAAVCRPAGPGAWLHPASTRRRTHRTGGRGPSVPLFGGIGGAPVLSAFHVPKQVTTTMRELSRGTHGRSACMALSALAAWR